MLPGVAIGPYSLPVPGSCGPPDVSLITTWHLAESWRPRFQCEAMLVTRG